MNLRQSVRDWWQWSDKGCLVAVLVLVGLGAVGAITVVVAGNALLDTDEADAAEIVECETDQAGFMVAIVAVTNQESFQSNFIIDVVFEGETTGSEIDSGHATVRRLNPGQATDVEAHSLTEAPVSGFTCDLSSVDQSTSS